MNPTSLSPEFYTNLYKQICETNVDNDVDMSENTCSVFLDFDDVEGLSVSLKAIFKVNFIDDSFDHAFGTEHAWHCEVGELTDIEDVYLYDEDDNNVSHLFDYDKFFEQFHKDSVKLYGCCEIKSGDTILVNNGRNATWMERTFLYYNELTGLYVCVPVGAEDDKRNRRVYKRVAINNARNRERLYVA